MNQHIVDVTIIWPDDKWDSIDEQAYLLNCLQGVQEHFIQHPITYTNQTGNYPIF